ncbi:MAG: uroporphyrinogen decarboxylase family protein [Thermofilaceae archaeon]|nr:uroporphyrinogen decarboxylase family protein [Thermofilaceae archaeon]
MPSSRERCIRAVEREEVDMVPLSLWIEVPEPAGSLMAALNASDVEDLLKSLEIDYRGFLPNISWLGIGLRGGYEEGFFTEVDGRRLYRNVFGVVSAFSSNGRTNMYVKHPLSELNVKDYVFPEPREEDFDKVEKFRKLYDDYCVIGYALQPFETACALLGYSKVFKLIVKGAKEVDYVLDKLFSITELQAKMLAEAGVDQVYSGDDVGAQTTMMISPELWRRLLKPRYKRLADLIHKYGAFFHFHSDGWIEPIIPDLIEIGVDVLDPLQPEAMNVGRIKKLYGDRLSFEGCIGVQTLPLYKPQDVATEVENTIKAMGPTGFTLRPCHTILPETPIENILTLYNVAKKCRRLAH